MKRGHYMNYNISIFEDSKMLELNVDEATAYVKENLKEILNYLLHNGVTEQTREEEYRKYLIFEAKALICTLLSEEERKVILGSSLEYEYNKKIQVLTKFLSLLNSDQRWLLEFKVLKSV